MARTTNDACEVSPVSMQQWDALLDAFPQHTIFHRAAWLTTLEEALNVKPVLAKVSRGGQLVAAWPCLEMRRGPFRVLGSPLKGWGTAYMGPLLRDGDSWQPIGEAIMRNSLIGRSSYFECRVREADGAIDLRPFGFEHALDFETYLLDLTPTEDELWGNLKHECRNRIKKARKAELTVQRETDDSFMDEFWAMSEDVFAKSNLTPSYTRKFAQAVWNNLAPVNSVSVFSAMHQGKRVAVLIVVHDRHTSYLWATSSQREFGNIGANNIIHWDAILEAKQRGSKWLDFISSKGGPGRFKKTFNPQPKIVATHWTRTGSRLAGLLKRGYERYLWKRRGRRVEVEPEAPETRESQVPAATQHHSDPARR